MSYKHLRHNIGSVSSGTMRPQDLIPTFLNILNNQKPLKRAHHKLIRDINSNLTGTEDSVEFYYQSEESIYDLESLFDALDEYCLPYFYFGAHPGDGIDYGFWLPESFQDDMEQEGIPQVGGLDELQKGYTGQVLVVNDHGNCSFYNVVRGRAYEIWSAV